MLQHIRENILLLTDAFAYNFEFPGECYKVTTIMYWIEVLLFVEL